MSKIRRRSHKLVTVFIGVILVSTLAACSKTPPIAPLPPDLSAGGEYKIGTPYVINGITYLPEENWNYQETGVASWYGPNFHGKNTANGETFDQNAITAAHKTLPMPSLVEVLNLQNQRSIVVRVNDRGPFVKDRIIDLSRRAAQLLGFETQGTTPVHVRLLERESRILKQITLGERPSDSNPELTNIAYQPTTANQLSNPQEIPEDLGIVKDNLGLQNSVSEETLTINGHETSATVITVPQEDDQNPNIVREETLTINGQKISATIVTVPQEDTQEIIPQVPQIDDLSVIEAQGGTEVFISDAPPITKDGDIILKELFYVQIGAFKQLENAQKLAADLSIFGAAQIQEADVNNAKFFRVRLGPLNTPQETQELALKLINAGHGNVQILRLEPTYLLAPPSP